MTRSGSSDAALPWRTRLRQVFVWLPSSTACMILFKLVWRFRRHGMEHRPRRGAHIIVANHQSHFDPVITGISIYPSIVRSLARDSLFRVPVLGIVIRMLGAIPLKRGESDTGAMRVALATLEKGQSVVLFPEGTRTPDGDIGEFKTGFMLLVKRSRCPVLPIAIDGAFDVFPKGASRPRLSGRIRSRIGAAIPADELLAMSREDATARVRGIIDQMRNDLRADSSQQSPTATPHDGPGSPP